MIVSHVMKAHFTNEAYVRNVMTTESNEISLLLRNFDRQFAVVPTRADQGPRLPDLTDEVV